MRNKTLASLLILCGSTAAFAAIPQGSGSAFQDIPQNNSATPGERWTPDTANNGVTPADTPDAPKPDATRTGDDQRPKDEPKR